MSIVISKNLNLVKQARREANITAENLNKHLELYSSTGLAPVTATNLKQFAADPKKFFHEMLKEQAKEKGMEGVVPEQYAKLYNITFFPDLKRLTIYPNSMKYIKMKEGKVSVVADLDKQTEGIGVVESSTPEQEEAAKLLLKLFSDFTYVASVLHHTPNVYLAGTNHFGFTPMNAGHPSMDTVNQLAEAMKRVPREEFNKRLRTQFGNPGLDEVNSANT